ncbi:MAG: PilZ domain-containing protein [Desulfuromonadales bacterium]|uniref:PilZ domain-containing protein n=1 Tax=Desulfuromonas sp. KJ2020 TaxID=2919173 RepID=UPI0020A78C12|nr:PilZ domain-containing protein [Desulfuromonas sp. KJ2020]MCP3176057.1 PilZ domain-containing protein [Desulfuromonas sp. KJ2020]
MGERRNHERFDLSVDIKVMDEGGRTTLGITQNFSDGGALVQVDLEPPPAVGTVMSLQIHDPGSAFERPVLKARVIRVSAEGIAFELLHE